jgi:hypothetical protein
MPHDRHRHPLTFNQLPVVRLVRIEPRQFELRCHPNSDGRKRRSYHPSMPRSLTPLVLLVAAIVAAGSTICDSRPPLAAPDICGRHCPDHARPIASCHRPGQPAPFSLLSYDDVKAQGKEIAAATHADDAALAGDQGPGFPRSKTIKTNGQQIEAIGNWVKNGIRRPAKAPAPPSYRSRGCSARTSP